jgi:hypothetical protein
VAVEDPGQLQVVCDSCGEEEMMDTTQYAGDPPTWGVDSSTLDENGWTSEGGETFCKDCGGNTDR